MPMIAGLHREFSDVMEKTTSLIPSTLRCAAKGWGFSLTTAIVVDDSALMRRMLRASLESLDVTVLCEAASGEEAVERCSVYNPDVITMDITIPGMNGIEATELITKLCPNSKVIMVTAMATNFLLQDAYAAGAVGCVVKPFVLGQLGEELQRVMSHTSGSNDAHKGPTFWR
jgi:two-component system, chemotaxis family, chemotaxis protein CheY